MLLVITVHNVQEFTCRISMFRLVGHSTDKWCFDSEKIEGLNTELS